MPLFRAPRSSGISNLVRAFVGSNGNLTAADMAALDDKRASIDRNTSLAEKARMEVEQMRRAESVRNDPLARRRQAALTSGLRESDAAVLDDFIAGLVDQRPEGITPEMERAYRAQRGAIGAVDFATGKTNAQQMTAAGGNILSDLVRQEIARTPGAAGQNQLKAALPGSGYREPFGNVTAQGLVTNQETGDVSVGNEGLIGETVRRLSAQANQAGAAAGLSTARRDEITNAESPRNRALDALTLLRETKAVDSDETRPSRIDRNTAAAAGSRARAEAASAKTNEERTSRAQASARSAFRADPQMKGKRLGKWVDGEGYEVLDKAGKLVGYYD